MYGVIFCILWSNIEIIQSSKLILKNSTSIACSQTSETLLDELSGTDPASSIIQRLGKCEDYITTCAKECYQAGGTVEQLSCEYTSTPISNPFSQGFDVNFETTFICTSGDIKMELDTDGKDRSKPLRTILIIASILIGLLLSCIVFFAFCLFKIYLIPTD